MLPFCPNEPKLDICMDGIIEQTWLLLYKAYLSPPPLEVNLSEGSTANCDGAIAP